MNQSIGLSVANLVAEARLISLNARNMPSVVGLARSKAEKKSAYKLHMTNRINKRLEQKVNETTIVLTSMTSKLNFFVEAVTMNMDVTNELVEMVEAYRETHLAIVAYFNGPVPRRPVVRATLWCLVMRVNGKSLETATWQ